MEIRSHGTLNTHTRTHELTRDRERCNLARFQLRLNVSHIRCIERRQERVQRVTFRKK